MRLLILITFILFSIALVAQTRDSLNPVQLDTVSVKPFLSWEAFKDSFTNMAPAEKPDLFRYYQPPEIKKPEIENYLPVFEVFPGVNILILPGYIGIGVSIDEAYNELHKMRRKRKRSKILPKFE